MLPKIKRLSITYARMQFGRVVIGDVLYSKGGSFGPRRQADYQLVIIHSGSLTLTVDHEVLEVQDHQAILLSPGHLEQFYFARDSETRHSWIAVRAEMLDETLKREFAQFRGPFPFLGRMASILDVVRQTVTPAASTDLLHTRVIEALAVAILCDFANSVANGRKPTKVSETPLWRMKWFITESYARSLTLNEIARAAGASRQHLLKLCRHSGAPTPMEQLYARRLEVAADLLLHTGFSIAEVSDRSGFRNQFHFSRKFKQNFGSSPSSWRGRFWKHPEVGRAV
jgi:AraC-like DNA-binding protein